jgi:hypothetical protein
VWWCGTIEPTLQMQRSSSNCVPEQMTALAGMHAVLHQRSLSLGIEYGNVHGFFSDAKAHPHAEAKAFDGGVRELTGDLRGASVRMEDRVQIDSDHLSRRLTFTMLDDARLYDLVSRFVVIDRSGVREGWINGQAVGHRARSVYHQFPASEAVVPVGHAHWLRARFRVEGELPPGLDLASPPHCLATWGQPGAERLQPPIQSPCPCGAESSGAAGPAPRALPHS